MSAPERHACAAAGFQAHHLVGQVRPAGVVAPTIPVAPSSSRATPARTAAALSGSRCAVGSSSSTSGAPSSRRRNARASAIRWRWPADSRVPALAEAGGEPVGQGGDDVCGLGERDGPRARPRRRRPGRRAGRCRPRSRRTGTGAAAPTRSGGATRRRVRSREVHPPVRTGDPAPARRASANRSSTASSVVFPAPLRPGDAAGSVPGRQREVDPVQGAGPRATGMGQAHARRTAARAGRRARAGTCRCRGDPPGRSSTANTCSAAATPSMLAWNRAPTSRSGRYASGARISTSSAVSRSRLPVEQPEPDLHGDQRHRQRREQLQHERRQERDPQRAHRRLAVRLGHPPDQRDLGLGPAEDRQRRQALDGVEEVPAEPLQQVPLLAGVLLRLHADQRHEHRDQRQGQRDDQRRRSSRRRNTTTSTATGTSTASTSWGR